MALAGRTWAQVASGRPSTATAAAEVEPTVAGSLEAPSNAAGSVLLSKVGLDQRQGQKVLQKEGCAAPEAVLQAPAELVLSASTDKVALRAGTGERPTLAMPESVCTAISRDVAKTLGKPTETDAPPCATVIPAHEDDRSTLLFKAAQTANSTSVEVDLNRTVLPDVDCILCRGSGLLCMGLLKDPCPLCEVEGDTAVDVGPILRLHSAVSDGSTHDAPLSEADLAEAYSHSGSVDAVTNPQQFGNEDDSQSWTDNYDCLADVTVGEQAFPKPAGAMTCTAPPGIGPPGVWVWPHADTKAQTENSKDSDEDQEEDMSTSEWPEHPLDSVEVEFIGKVAQSCFGSDFIKMTVTWDDPVVQGQLIMPKVNVQLHLEPMAPVYLDFLAPLTRLQSLLHRDQAYHSCQISRLSIAKDSLTMDLSCAVVTSATCWDILKKGYCPRPACTWPHPVPTLVNVSWTGGPEMHMGADDGKIQHGPGFFSITNVIDKPQCDLCNAQFNIGAYSSDDSSDDM